MKKLKFKESEGGSTLKLHLISFPRMIQQNLQIFDIFITHQLRIQSHVYSFVHQHRLVTATATAQRTARTFYNTCSQMSTAFIAETCWPKMGLDLTDADLSMLSMECADDVKRRKYSFDIASEKIDSVQQLVKGIDTIFKQRTSNWSLTRKELTNLLDIVNLSTDEVNKFTFWDSEKPYTRNLISTDNANYTLLLLCWNPGKESKIHNHPCDGCFVKTLRGCIRESRYTSHKETNEIRLESVRFFNEGQVSYMSDDIGLHKIGNPNKDTGSVSLHLYTPPFKSCNVWHNHGVGSLDQHEEGKMGYFSVQGHRSPHLEGRPGTHSKVMAEVLTRARALILSKSLEVCAELTRPS